MKLGQVEIGSDIAHNHSSSPYDVISGHFVYPNSYEKLTKIQVGIGLNIAQNHFSSP